MSWGKRHPNNVEIWRRNFWSHVSQGQLEGNGGFWHERLWWKRKKDILRLEACLSAQHWSDSSSTFWDVATGTNVLWRAPVEGHSNTDPRWKDGETHGKGCGDCKSIATSGERTSKKGPLQPVSVNYIANSLQNALLQALLYMIGKLIEIRAKNVLILLQFEFVCHPFSLLKSTLNWYIPHCPTSPFVRTCQPEGTKASGFGAGGKMRMMFCRIDLDSPGIVFRGFVALCKSGLVKLLSLTIICEAVCFFIRESTKKFPRCWVLSNM